VQRRSSPGNREATRRRTLPVNHESGMGSELQAERVRPAEVVFRQASGGRLSKFSKTPVRKYQSPVQVEVEIELVVDPVPAVDRQAGVVREPRDESVTFSFSVMNSVPRYASSADGSRDCRRRQATDRELTQSLRRSFGRLLGMSTVMPQSARGISRRDCENDGSCATSSRGITRCVGR